MTSINKQKFLAELGKLLTFMYEEDRQRAIELYSRMFEEADDERALLQSLVSPTRQAVIVARAYNSNLGRLSLNPTGKAAPEDLDENGVPDYVQAIEGVREQAWAAQGIPAARAHREAEPAEESESEEAESEEAESAEESAAEPAEKSESETPEAESADSEEAEAAEENESAEESAAEPTEKSESETPEAESAESEEAEPAEESESESEKAESAEESAAEPQEAPAAEAEEEKGEKLEGIEYFTMPEAGRETPVSETGAALLDENSFNVNSDGLKKTRRKPRVFLLILYILLAIPLTVCAVAVLLVPALLFLALSVAAIICGVVLVSTVISSIAALALLSDIMVMLGLALVLFALGLLFLWTAIWFVGGAIVGLVHGVAMLCDKWCYKEVSEV